MYQTGVRRGSYGDARSSSPLAQTTAELESSDRTQSGEFLVERSQRWLRRVQFDQARDHRMNLVPVPDTVAVLMRKERGQEACCGHRGFVEHRRFVKSAPWARSTRNVPDQGRPPKCREPREQGEVLMTVAHKRDDVERGLTAYLYSSPTG